MSLKQLIRPANRKVRVLVGLLLAVLFCIQCTRTDAVKSASRYVTAMSGKEIGETSNEATAELERLAKTDHVALLELCLKHVKANYGDYTCTLLKQERIRGKLLSEQEIHVKFMAEPFSVAMAWTPETAPMGDRALYVQGKYNNNMLVRPTSAALRFLCNPAIRNPECDEVMKSTLRPITQFGFENSLQSLIDVYKEARENKECEESFGGYQKVCDRPVLVLVRYLPPRKDYPAHKTLTYIDMEYLVPIGIVGYGWNADDELLCSYIYKDLKFNVGLDEDDFTPSANGIKDP